MRDTRRQDKRCILGSVRRRAVGDLLEVLHSTERVVMAVAPFLMMMTLRITELRTGRERASTESQMITVQMMRRRLRRRRRHLQFSTHLREDSHLIASTLVCLRCIAPKVPNYVIRVNYKAKGMTERAREQRSIDPRS